MNEKNKVNMSSKKFTSIDSDKVYKELRTYKYVSFDIFDTLLKRNVKKPVDIFKIMELSIGNDFAARRVKAEQEARKSCTLEEVTLDEIYKYLTIEEKNQIAKQELTFEYDAIVPNLPMIDVYNRCIEDGKIVFITTDMYWPIEAIEKVLDKIGVKKYSKIYLSSKEKKTKRSGSLFQLLLDDQKIDASDLVHIGDNYVSDYKIPTEMGIKSIKIPTYVHTISFRKLTSGIENNYMNSLIKNSYVVGENEYYEFGFSQFGKLLWGFSNWIHDNAQQKGIQELYFFSRDGWIMKKAYDLCIRDNSIQTHYLEVSRRSLRGPILWMNFEYDNVLDMIVNSKLVSIKSIFDSLGLEINDYTNILEQYDISKEKVYDRKTIRDDEDLKSLIFSLKKDIIDNSKREYDALGQYLKKNNVNGKFGVVDIGYGGSMQRYLNLTLNEMNIPHEMIGFYLAVAGYYKKNSSIDHPLDLYGYLFDFKHDAQAYDSRSSFVGLFESLFLEQGGSVKRYIQEGNDVIVERYPYEYLENGKVTDDYKKIKSLQKGALDFVKIAANDKLLEKFNYSANDLFYGIYKTGTDPNGSDLKLFSDMKFYDEGITTKLADPKSIFYYALHKDQLKNDFLSCRWKIGFMKKLFKVKLPYQDIYEKLKKVDGD